MKKPNRNKLRPDFTEYILIKGARVHNLKNINVKIPRNELVVITGLSGSGKSSLAFDTIYAEGQRRYIESLSAYARQFLGMLDKPDVDYITGLSPAIAIEQRSASKNPRSTVGTVTEIYDYLRVLFARIGTPYCPDCNKPITSQSVDSIVDSILSLPDNTSIIILAPIIRGRKGEYRDLLDKIKRKGFLRVRVDGKISEIDEVEPMQKFQKHNIEIVIDRLTISEQGGVRSEEKRLSLRKRIADSVELALKEGQGLVVVSSEKRGEKGAESRKAEEKIYSSSFACVDCGFSYGEISPRLFSFNAPYGACPVCHGLGIKMEIDENRIIANSELSITNGAIASWGEVTSEWFLSQLEELADNYDFNLKTPWKNLPKNVKKVIIHGNEDAIGSANERSEVVSFEGVIPHIMRLYHETESDSIRDWAEKYMSILPCPDCNGTRLKKEALSIKINNLNIADVSHMSIKQATEFFTKEIKLTEKESLIAKEVIKEITRRLQFLVSVGLDYLTLNRRADSLGGGEEQRVRLATQIGSGLVGVVYILDEPSIGLHQRDNKKLLATLHRLRDLGNTVIVVEHDEETIRESDYVIDLGPGAGEQGGYVVATGTPKQIISNPKSLTGAYLNGRKSIPLPKQRRRQTDNHIIITGAQENNLKSIDVKIPLGLFVCITGVSGSGKSTLIFDILYNKLAQTFYNSKTKPGEHKSIQNINKIDKVINIDQSPIGRTPRSNPATYTNLFTPIRELFAQTREARMRGYKPGRFSFNVFGGRCETCEGDGIIKVEMHFLPAVYIPCEECKGKRYNRETLDIKYKGKNIYDVLNMTVTEALEFFYNIPMIKRKLELLKDVGLGYIKLGQSAPTLSGGEAQRVKISKELSKIGTGNTLYLLDEPTTGLHFEDVNLLLAVLNRLVDKGNTVVVIEHNLEVIKCADWIIDLGPEGGDKGGQIVAQGTPEQVAKIKGSYTGQFLKGLLK
ncbi:MAG: excinuclease ABC subunit UvrA [Candidatus Latescibacteria bacterium]|nr:excinuclease ABC subunit UvrA [Candidatus Latescibacterota bacterium]